MRRRVLPGWIEPCGDPRQTRYCPRHYFSNIGPTGEGEGASAAERHPRSWQSVRRGSGPTICVPGKRFTIGDDARYSRRGASRRRRIVAARESSVRASASRKYYIHRRPSPKAAKRLPDRVQEPDARHREGRGANHRRLQARALRLGHYFRMGGRSREFLAADAFVYLRLVRWFYPRAGNGRRSMLMEQPTVTRKAGTGCAGPRATPGQAASGRSSLSRVRATPYTV